MSAQEARLSCARGLRAPEHRTGEPHPEAVVGHILRLSVLVSCTPTAYLTPFLPGLLRERGIKRRD